MADGVSISLGAGDRAAVKLDELALAHHYGGSVRVDIPQFNGGNVLRLALSTCVFNVVMRLAEERGITVTDLAVTTEGDIGGANAGLRYDVRIAGDRDAAELRELVAAADASSPVGLALPPGIPVAMTDVHVTS